MAVNIDKMDIEIRQRLDIYLANTQQDVIDAVEETAKETVQELRKTSPVRKGGKGGEYAKNWAYKRDKKLRGRWFNSMVVYNRDPTYRLTHLLEKEHASRNGGRVKPQPHIAPAEEIAYTKLYAKLVRKLRYRD